MIQVPCIKWDSLNSLRGVLVRFTIAVMKHHNQNNLGRRGFIWLTHPHHSSSSEEVRAGTQAEQVSGGRSCYKGHRGIAYWFIHMPCSACFLPEPRTTSQGMVPSTMVWALHHKSPRKYPVGMPTACPFGSIFSIEVPSSNVFSLFQAELSSTGDCHF